jgi:hypothetical protein
MNCTNEQMVCYATFKLTAEAEHGWMAKKEHMQQQLGKGMCISWEDFKDAFLGRFFPQTVRHAKAQEFMDLTQGSMTGEHCAAKFVKPLKN